MIMYHFQDKRMKWALTKYGSHEEAILGGRGGASA
jgi:hypothetical protein